MSLANTSAPSMDENESIEDTDVLNVRLSLIVAMANNRCIGINNKLPWRLPADLQYFKRVTQGKAIVMGRSTYDSLGRPLPNRTNIVMTRQPDWRAPEGVRVVHSLEAAIALAEAVAVCNFQDEAVIIGGAEIYRLALPLVSRLYVTEVDTLVAGDAFFPEWTRSDWQEMARECFVDEATQLNYCFVVYDRV